MHILFVCTGNTCRSPLAEGMMRSMVQKENLAVEIRSAGVSASNGGAISRHSSIILREKGFHEVLASSSLEQSQVKWADLILTMTGSHKRTVIQRFPEAVDKIFTLKEFVEDDPDILAAITELEKVAAEIQLKQALSGNIAPEERNRLMLLKMQMPDYDISDPFGGPLEVYRAVAAEIEQSLYKLILKMKG